MTGFRVEFFDTWRPGYAGATIEVRAAIDDSLCDLFTDADLTVPADNPQILSSYSQNGISYGKFFQPLYTDQAYRLTINSIDRTGIIRVPIDDLDGQDVSTAVITASGGSQLRALEDVLEDYGVPVLNHGAFLASNNPSASSATNSASLQTAIGIAAAGGGGIVFMPAGTYRINSITVPQGVILRGRGIGATKLQSEFNGVVVTMESAEGALQYMTLDGVSVQAGSVGIFSKAVDRSQHSHLLITGFETGSRAQGGRDFDWNEVSVDGCNKGVEWHGDMAASSGNDGAAFQHNSWRGGVVSNCTTAGIELKYVDAKCWNNTLRVGFLNNTGTALKVIGARWTGLGDECWFEGNGVDIDISDGSDITKTDENTVVGFHMEGGEISSDMNFAGKCQDVVFRRVNQSSGTFTLTTVENNILSIDCVEGDAVVLAGGDSRKWVRSRQQLGDFPSSDGVTTDVVATESWTYKLAPGEKIHCEAVIIANGRNTIDYAYYHIATPAQRPGSTLNYDAQTSNFTTGQIITGATSGATARITADTDSGATGALTLRDIVGAFVDNEIIADALTGSATVDGILLPQDAVLLGSITPIEAAVESDAAFDATFDVTADTVRVMVTGVAAKTVEWTVSVKVTSG